MDKLKIHIPAGNIEEKKYIIQIIIEEYLGFSYDLFIEGNQTGYALQFENKKIILNDAFFSHYYEPLEYLKQTGLPEKIAWFSFAGFKMPIIYGEDNVKIENDTIYCGLDIFASAFFMLTRWEETVISARDKFGRCDESQMLVVRKNIFDLPVVDEYCSLLAELLKEIGVKVPKSRNSFNVLITHDIDFLFRYGSLKSLGQNLAGDLLNRKSFYCFRNTLSDYFNYRRGLVKDPFDTFDELMDMSEKNGFISAFFFKPSLPGERDSTYSIFDPRVVRLINHIHNRGHEVGFHPSKNTFRNRDQFMHEFKRLESLGIPINGGRQHFLLYDIQETFTYWEEAGLKYDSGLGFSNRAGFRCGTCRSFRMFDILRRKPLKLVQKPLCFMDAALIQFQPDPDYLIDYISKLVARVKKHSGIFVCLWHNDGFRRPENSKYKIVYENILKLL